MDLENAAEVRAAAELCASPAWYPLKLAADRVSFIRLEEADYAAASFLDERLLQGRPPARAFSPAATIAAAGHLRPRAHYLFHVGHVGSTLISRLIGARPGLFSLREPVLLRARSRGTAAGETQLPLRALLGLLARTWRVDQRAVIKLTSVVNEIAGEILAVSEAPRALLVFTRPLPYLRGIFGGPNSRIESRALAAERLQRLVRRHPAAQSASPRSEGEWIAMSWLCEMSALVAIARAFPLQVHWVDFDEFLAAPAPGLAAMLAALGSPAAPADLEPLLAGHIMRRYSKAPEHAYDAALRREVQRGADQDYGSEIRQGASWLDSLARRDAAIGAILEARG